MQTTETLPAGEFLTIPGNPRFYFEGVRIHLTVEGPDIRVKSNATHLSFLSHPGMNLTLEVVTDEQG
jgi:hypothetical protein